MPAVRPGDVPADVAGYAQLAVGSWLGAGPDDAAAVDALFVVAPTPPSSVEGPATRLRAERLAAIAGREIEPGYWAVTVAALVGEDRGIQGWHEAGTWFFDIGVLRGTDGRLVAISEPALVPAPTAPRERPGVAGGALARPRPDDAPLVGTVEAFLAALLTGSGEIDRYTVPGLAIDAVSPAPFGEVAVEAVAVSDEDEAGARARVTVIATTPSGTTLSLGYELLLSSRAGRWEIAGVSGAPALAGESSDTQPAGTTAPTSTSVGSSPSSATPGA